MSNQFRTVTVGEMVDALDAGEIQLHMYWANSEVSGTSEVQLVNTGSEPFVVRSQAIVADHQGNSRQYKVTGEIFVADRSAGIVEFTITATDEPGEFVVHIWGVWIFIVVPTAPSKRLAKVWIIDSWDKN